MVIVYVVCINVFFLQKLQKKFDSGPDRFQTLKNIVNSEIAEGTTKAKNSATDALLWLKRWYM